MVLPLAVAAAMVAVFMAGPLFGLPLIGRYVRTPAMLLALFYGLAVTGFALLPRGSAERRRWALVGVVAAGLSVVFLPWQVRMVDSLHDRVARDGKVYRDLQAVGYAPAVRAAFEACGRRITTADRKPIPYLRWWLHGPPGSVRTLERSRLLLVPRRTGPARGFYGVAFPAAVRPSAGWRVVYSNRSWRVFGDPGCSPPSG